MSLLRLILFLVLFYIIYHIARLFIVNFRIGTKSKGKFQRDKKPESKYDNIEEADFTEIKKKDENTEK